MFMVGYFSIPNGIPEQEFAPVPFPFRKAAFLLDTRSFVK